MVSSEYWNSFLGIVHIVLIIIIIIIIIIINIAFYI